MSHQKSYCYSFSLKCKVVRLYSRGFSCVAISSLTGISESYVQTLIRAYLCGGLDSVRLKRGHHYSQEFKLSIILEIENKGLSLFDASVAHHVGLTSVYNWLRQYHSFGRLGFLQLQSLHRKRDESTSEEMSKKIPIPASGSISRERELELELEKARAEIAYFKKLRALVLEEEKLPSKRKSRSSGN